MMAYLNVHDTSDALFKIYICEIEGDSTGDCIIDMYDLAVIAESWLQCGNPYDPGC